MIDNRNQESLGLARPRPGGDQRGLGLLASARQPLPRHELVGIGTEAWWRPCDSKVSILRRFDEGQAHSQVWPPKDPVTLVEQELSQRLVGLIFRESKGRDEVLDDRGLEFTGNE